jgi:DNA polymerase-3 subunit epsilon
MRQIFADTETTGLKVELGNRVFEIGAVEYENKLPTGRVFHYYLDPGREMEPGATMVHGFTWADMKGKPKWADINEEWCDFIDGAELFFHNADFDTSHIVNEMTLCNSPRPFFSLVHDVVNTLTRFRKVDPGQSSYSQTNVMKRFNVPDDREFHGALRDAQLLAQTYYKVMEEAPIKLFDYTNLPPRSPIVRVPVDANRPLRLVLATPEETAAHDAFLQAMEKETKQTPLGLQAAQVATPVARPSGPRP